MAMFERYVPRKRTAKVNFCDSVQKFFHEWRHGKYPTERLGQAFCNRNNIADSELFYSTDVQRCLELMYTHVNQKEN